MYHCNLRNAHGRQPGLIRERAAALHKHFALVKQVCAARLHEMNERQLIFLSDFLGAQRLSKAHGRNRAAFDPAIACGHKCTLSRHNSYSNNGAPTHDAGLSIVIVHAPSSKRRKLEEWRTAIEDARDALTRQDLTAFRELFRLLRRMRDHRALDPPKMLDLRQKMRGIGFESLGLESEPR